jgi:hypothetical protein
VVTIGGITATLDLTCSGLCDGSFSNSDVLGFQAPYVAFGTLATGPQGNIGSFGVQGLTIAGGAVTAWTISFEQAPAPIMFFGDIRSSGGDFFGTIGAPFGENGGFFNSTPGTWTVNLAVPGPIVGTGLPGLLLLGAFWLGTKTGLGASRHPASKA